MTLQGWNEKLKPYIGKPHNHFCWPLSKPRIGTTICRLGLHRPYGVSRALAAGLFALWAATQNDALYGVAAASPSVWFPGWQEHEAARPIQTQRVYLSLGDREEHTKNQTMASVGDNIRALHTALTQRGTACTLEWNTGGHFKDVDLRTARAFAWTMESE